jgi:hypothetical protein
MTPASQARCQFHLARARALVDALRARAALEVLAPLKPATTLATSQLALASKGGIFHIYKECLSMKQLLLILALAASACGGTQAPPAPPPPPKVAAPPPVPDQLAVAALAHKVAEIEIGIAKVSFEKESSGGARHPEQFMADAMAAVPAEIVNWRALPPDQLALLRDVATRIGAANRGYSQAFTIEMPRGEQGLGLNSWSAAAVVEGAYVSAQGDPSQEDALIQPDLAAALALQEIKQAAIIKGDAK